MNPKQTIVFKIWLALVVILAIFPPFETRHREVLVSQGISLSLAMGSTTQHGFVLHNDWIAPPEDDPVIKPWLRDGDTTINLPAILCEFLAITALTGLVFVSVRDKG